MTPKNDNPSKTLGRRSASLVMALHERGRPIFTLADAQDITGLKGELRCGRWSTNSLVAVWRRGFGLGSSNWFRRS